MFCNLKSDWSLVSCPFRFQYLCPLSGTWFERKNKVNFLRLFDNLFSKYLLFIFLEFLACNGCLELFIKIKKGSGTNFWCTFSAWFFHKNVSYLILYLWTKFICHTFFPSQDIKQNVFNHPLKQWPTGRKGGKDGNTKIWISRERKELFRLNEKYFSWFLKRYHLVKK